MSTHFPSQVDYSPLPEEKRETHKTRGKILVLLTALLISLSTLVMLFLVNFGQICSLFVYPFSRRLFREMNRWVPDTFWRYCGFVLEKILNVPVVFSGTLPPLQENAIVLPNHQTGMDIIAVAQMAILGKSGGDLKFLAKDILKYVPFIGLGMKFLGCLFLKRDWTKDKQTIYKAFGPLIEKKIPLWLTTYVEGTRITPEKLKVAQEFARRHGMRVPRHVMIPRSKGLIACVQGLRTHVQAVYDITLAYDSPGPSLLDYILGNGPGIHVHFRRIPIESLPKSEKELTLWLRNLFYEKDDLLAYFATHGKFPEEGPGPSGG